MTRLFFLALVVSVAVAAIVFDPPTGRADEGPNPFDTTGAPANPTYDANQRLNFGEPKPGVTAAAPREVSVFFRRFEFDLLPSTLEVWIDGVEHTESLRFWDDRAWMPTPDPFWTAGPHSVVARITDDLGSVHEETVDFDWKAPNNLYPSPVSVSEVTNLFEDFQSFTNPPYWHSGLDLRTAAGTPVLASVGGTVVKVLRYRTIQEVNVPDNYWEVAIEDADGYVWQYHHIEKNSITVQVNDVVAQGDTLGEVVEWSSNVNGHLYNHLHVNVTRWLGPGPLPKPYQDGFEYYNPLLFIEQPAGADTVFPTEMEVWFIENEGDTIRATDSDQGAPILSGDVDIVARLEDLRTEVPAIPGHPYDLGLYDLAYSVEPITAKCQMAWIPRTQLARFDKIPGDSLVATQLGLLLEVYKKIIYAPNGNSSYTSQFINASRRFLYTMTNGFFGTIDADKGYWNTDAQPILGVKFPDGHYVVRLYLSDFDGNELVYPINVTVLNGLSFTGNCPEWVGTGNGGDGPGGSLTLQRTGLPDETTTFGSFPVDFSGGTEEGSARTTVANTDWPVWYFDYPGLNQRVAIGVLDGNEVDVEYVPYLGDVILEIPAEVQVLPLLPTGPSGPHDGDALSTAGVPAPEFDPSAASTNPVSLRLSTRLARNEWSSAAHVGSPHTLGDMAFTLVEAETLSAGGVTMLFKTAAGGLPMTWTIDVSGVGASVDPAPAPKPLLRVFPNPFGAELDIQLSLIAPGEVRVEIVSVAGRLVRTLHQGRLESGTKVFLWDGLDDAGRTAGPGVYFVRAQGDGIREVTKTVRLR